MDFAVATTGNQLRSALCRSGVAIDAGRCGGLGRAGCRVAFGGQFLPVGARGTDRWAVARSLIGVDGGGRRAHPGMDEDHRRAGGTDGRSGQVGGRRL